jgi:hypothetical protein
MRCNGFLLIGLISGTMSVCAQPKIPLDRPEPARDTNGVLELNLRQVFRASDAHTKAQLWEGGLEITIRNISPRPVHLVESTLFCDISVSDPAGKPVPRTEYGRQIAEAQQNRPSFPPPVSEFDLPPGKDFTNAFGLSSLFKIEPGQDYTVTLRRREGGASTADASGKHLTLRELRCTLKAVGRPSNQ